MDVNHEASRCNHILHPLESHPLDVIPGGRTDKVDVEFIFRFIDPFSSLFGLRGLRLLGLKVKPCFVLQITFDSKTTRSMSYMNNKYKTGKNISFAPDQNIINSLSSL